MNISEIYTKAYYKRHVDWRQDYTTIADSLARHLDFNSVLDLGCGHGYILARLHELGKTVCGVDGSSYALAVIPPKIRDCVTKHDLSRPLALGKFDLVICTEVAEHLESRFADQLVNTICANAGRWIYFTAAVPGQGGHSHVNEQPHGYWVEKFKECGCKLLRPRTDILRKDLAGKVSAMWWFPRNSMVFQCQTARQSGRQNRGGNADFLSPIRAGKSAANRRSTRRSVHGSTG